MEGVRPFTAEDIPAVVALRRKVFPRTERPAPADLGAYFERMFFAGPWRDDGLPSLVHVDAGGRVTGFIGVVPRRASFRGEPVVAAVSTQLMVEPGARGVAGIRLARAFLAGPQDLSYADLGTDASRRLWEGLGGRTSHVQSLSWTELLRPWRYRTGCWARRRGWRLPMAALRPLCAVADAASRRRGRAVLAASALTAAAVAEAAPGLLHGVAVQPRYDEASLRWLLDQLEAKRALGELVGALLTTGAGVVAGWCLYFANRGGVGEVVQIAARRDSYPDVLDWLLRDARRRGLTAVSGRVEPALLGPLGRRRTPLARRGPWVLLHSRRRDVLAALQRGDAFLSRLEGEWWMSF